MRARAIIGVGGNCCQVTQWSTHKSISHAHNRITLDCSFSGLNCNLTCLRLYIRHVNSSLHVSTISIVSSQHAFTFGSTQLGRMRGGEGWRMRASTLQSHTFLIDNQLVDCCMWLNQFGLSATRPTSQAAGCCCTSEAAGCCCEAAGCCPCCSSKLLTHFCSCRYPSPRLLMLLSQLLVFFA